METVTAEAAHVDRPGHAPEQTRLPAGCTAGLRRQA